MTRKVFSEAEIELVRRNYADSSTADLATVCGCSEEQIFSLAKRLGLKKDKAYLKRTFGAALAKAGEKHRFQKGQVPPNKGMKMPEGWCPGNMARTQFKPGSQPVGTMPVGSHRINYGNRKRATRPSLEFKFSDEPGPYTNRWIPVTRKVWIEANGPVPPGHVVAFKPGRYSVRVEDITLDALECITNAENVRRNSIQNLPPELAQVHRLRGVLTRAINRKTREADGPAPTEEDATT